MGAVPIGMAVAGAGAGAINTRRTARRQDRALADSIRNQRASQRQMDASIAQQLTDMQGSRQAGDRAAALSEYLAQLQAAAGGMAAPGVQVGRTSDDFQDAVQAAALGAAEAVNTRAGQMATQDATERMRTREASSQRRLAEELGLFEREARGQARLDQMRIEGIRRNPWLDAASGVLSGLASAGVGAGSGLPSGSMARAAGWGSAPAAARRVSFAPHLRIGGR